MKELLRDKIDQDIKQLEKLRCKDDTDDCNLKKLLKQLYMLKEASLKPLTDSSNLKSIYQKLKMPIKALLDL